MNSVPKWMGVGVACLLVTIIAVNAVIHTHDSGAQAAEIFVSVVVVGAMVAVAAITEYLEQKVDGE